MITFVIDLPTERAGYYNTFHSMDSITYSGAIIVAISLRAETLCEVVAPCYQTPCVSAWLQDGTTSHNKV